MRNNTSSTPVALMERYYTEYNEFLPADERVYFDHQPEFKPEFVHGLEEFEDGTLRHFSPWMIKKGKKKKKKENNMNNLFERIE